MLPWRVQLQRTLEALRESPAFRNRMLAFLAVMVFLIASFATGLEVNIRFGRTSDGELTPAAAEESTADRLAVDGVDDFARDPASGPGSAVASGADVEGRTSTATNAAGSAPVPSAGPRPGTGPPYRQLLASQLKQFTTVRDCSGVTPTATDRGVSAKEIKLGWLIPNLNELRAAGFEVGLAGDWNRIIPAWVNELNRLKLGCRKVTFVKETFDVLSVDDMVAKCKTMVNDHKVFAVFTPGGYDSVAQLCIARDNKTPFINPEPEPEGWYRQSAPYLWNMLMSKDRMHRNHVRWLVESKSLKDSHVVGVVYHDIPNVGPSVRAAMLPELAKHGIEPKRVTALSSDSEQAAAQINQVVVDFQQQGINYVFMPMNLIFKSQFMQQAEKQNYFPTYTDSDHYFGCFDFVTAAYSDRSWDRTKCVSAVDVAGMREADAEKFVKDHAYAKYADQVYLRSWKDGYDRGGRSSDETADTQRALFIGTGEQVLLFKQAADRVGVALTRRKWGDSMGRTGRYCTIVRLECNSFGTQKWDGPDLINVVQWHAEASNRYPERRYHRLVPSFRAYY